MNFLKNNINLCRSLLCEYTLGWVIYRILYMQKLALLRHFNFLENCFERQIVISRIDIFKFDNTKIQNFLLALPANVTNEIIDIANNAIQGKLKAFSSIYLDYGDPIDWQYSPLTNGRCDKTQKWYCIPDFDKERGDIKVIWEASRFTHFLFFARAYLLTRDKKYYAAFSTQLADWLENNIYSYGANFKCGQECSLRMLNALIAFSVFNNAGECTDNDAGNVCKLIQICYKKVLSNFFYAYKCIKNNHTFSEICGLIVGAWCCNDKKNLLKAYRLLDEEINSQFYSDGGYKQFSFNYQRFTLQIIECIFKMSETTGLSISASSKDKIKNSVLLMYNCQSEKGLLPNYGSNDGALVFPVTCCDYQDFRPTLNALYVQLTGKRLYKNGIYDEELLWFAKDKTSYDAVPRHDVCYNKAGIYVLRKTDDSYLVAFLQNFDSRPSHMDQLHIDVWHNGINIFCDGGTYSYASELGSQLSLTGAHNTAMVDNIEQMSKHGAFMVNDWTSRKSASFAIGRFDGIMASQHGYTHRRSVRKTEHGYEINDCVDSKKGGSCHFKFHTPFDVQQTYGGFVLKYLNKILCSVKYQGAIMITKTKISRLYLNYEDINCITVTKPFTNGRCTSEFIIDFCK